MADSRTALASLASADRYSWNDKQSFESWIRRMSMGLKDRILSYPHNATGRGKKLQTHRAIHITQETSVGHIQSAFIVLPDTYTEIKGSDNITVIGCKCDVFDPYAGKYELKVMKINVNVTLTPYESYDSSFYNRFVLQPFNSRHYETSRGDYCHLLKGLKKKIQERSKDHYRDKVQKPVMVEVTLFDKTEDAYVHSRVLLKIDTVQSSRDSLSFEVRVSSKTLHRMTFYSDKMPLLERNVHLGIHYLKLSPAFAQGELFF